MKIFTLFPFLFRNKNFFAFLSGYKFFGDIAICYIQLVYADRKKSPKETILFLRDLYNCCLSHKIQRHILLDMYKIVIEMKNERITCDPTGLNPLFEFLYVSKMVLETDPNITKPISPLFFYDNQSVQGIGEKVDNFVKLLSSKLLCGTAYSYDRINNNYSIIKEWFFLHKDVLDHPMFEEVKRSVFDLLKTQRIDFLKKIIIDTLKQDLNTDQKNQNISFIKKEIERYKLEELEIFFEQYKTTPS